MAYSEFLVERVRRSLRENHVGFGEKKMFGALCFFVDDKLCIGVSRENLLVRIDPENEEKYLREEDCRLMDDSGKSMRGFLLVSPEGIDMDDDLDKWIRRCLDFNPRAKGNRKSR